MTDQRCNADHGALTAKLLTAKLLEQQREIDRLTAERDEARRALAAWQANLEEPQEIDGGDLQALIDSAWDNDRTVVTMSARDLWRMASDHRGRNEP